MARNSGGSYSLPSGNPVSSGATIQSTWANTTLGDLATEMTDSLSRSGKGGMSSQFTAADGTVAAPGISFGNEKGSGWFRESAGVLKAAILGTYRLLLQASGAIVNGTLGIRNATANHIVTIDAGATLSADYTLTAPTALPGSTLPLQLGTGGAITAATLTRPQLPTLGQQVSSASGLFTNASGSVVDVTNLTVTITTTGRPVLLMIQPDGTNTASFGPARAGAATVDMLLTFVRGAATISKWEILSDPTGATSNALTTTSAVFLDVIGAGTYTYKVQVQALVSSTAKVSNCVLVAFEL